MPPDDQELLATPSRSDSVVTVDPFVDEEEEVSSPSSLDAEAQQQPQRQEKKEDIPNGRDHGSMMIPTTTTIPEQQKVSVGGAVANLCSATLGAGVLSLPFCMREAGLVVGVLLLVGASVATLWSIDMLVEACSCQTHEGTTSTIAPGYESLTRTLYGPEWVWMVETSVLVFCIGCAIAYVVAVGDILQQVFPDIPRTGAMVVVWATVMLPLSLLEKVHSLRFASGVGIVSICILAFSIMLHSLQHHHDQNDETDSNGLLLWPDSGWNVVRACPIVMFAFSCQVNVPAIYHEIGMSCEQQQQPQHSKRIMTQVARRGVAVCGVLYMCVGYFAVAEFSKQVQSNILQNYCSLGPQLGVAFVCMTAAIVMAFPLNIFPARITLDGILTRLYPSTQSSTMTPTDNDDDESSLSSLEEPLLREIGSQEDSPESTIDSRRNDERRKYCRHVTLTVGIAGLALVMAILVPDISIVFGLLGGTSSSLLNFIMPGLFCLKTRSRNSSSTGVGSLSKQEIRAWCLVVGGTLVGVTSTAVTLYSLFIPSNNATTDGDSSYCSTHHNTSITDESA
jgi:amino acid permease